nr:reverse transcriptase domain-containing protein [Tanacetum cinerariifolium]
MLGCHLKELTPKGGYPGSFTLPCLIGYLAVKNALTDFGESINLMPHSLFLRLGISELKPTKMSIQLADRLVKYPIRTKLLEVLKNHNGAIAWSIADIKGIDSSFCTHKILMKDEFKLVVQPQRRVNSNIKEMVKKEVIKLLDAGLIYLISGNPWGISKFLSPQKIKKKLHSPIRMELSPTKGCHSDYAMLQPHFSAEFDIEIRNKKGAENLAADHLSRLENPDLGKQTREEIRDLFLKEQLITISDKSDEPCKDMKSAAIKLCDEEGNEFIVNKQCVKPYQKDILDFDADDYVTLEDKGGVTAGDSVRIFPDSVVSPATVIFDKEKPGSS